MKPRTSARQLRSLKITVKRTWIFLKIGPADAHHVALPKPRRPAEATGGKPLPLFTAACQAFFAASVLSSPTHLGALPMAGYAAVLGGPVSGGRGGRQGLQFALRPAVTGETFPLTDVLLSRDRPPGRQMNSSRPLPGRPPPVQSYFRKIYLSGFEFIQGLVY